MIVRAAALLLLLFASGPAWPQAAASPPPALGLQEQPSQPNAPPPAEPAPPPVSEAPAENPGLIHEMGKLFGKLTPSLKSPSETIDDLNAKARDAGEALTRFAKPGSMVSGRMICPAAANGTPDCKAAADKLCQTKGYKEGKSLNSDSAQSCSAKVLIPGRTRKPDDCRNDYFVTTALCQ